MYRDYTGWVPAFRESLNRCLEKERGYGNDLSARERVFLHVFAPGICAYVIYVLEDAKKRGKKELYFLSRDAYLFHKAAEILGKVIAPDIKLTYLSVSRYSLRSA